MEGEDRIRLLNKPEDGEYAISVSITRLSLGDIMLTLNRCRIPTLEASYSER